MKPLRNTKVLIVDDSAFVRTILAQSLAEHADITVVGGATDPYEARDMIAQHHPDVLILDIEMPRMDGLTFLRKLMAKHPLPVIVCSGIAPASGKTALEAIACGAFDVLAKPTGGRAALRQLGDTLAEKIRAAALAGVRRPAQAAAATATTPPRPDSFRAAGLNPDDYLIALGASTGGTEAIRMFLEATPADFPPIAIVQHMPEGFTASFASRLNDLVPLTVTEGRDADALASGGVTLARGGMQMRVRGQRRKWSIQLGTADLVNRHCPSVDVLFESAARCAGRDAIGILLTGMGNDGAAGLLAMRQAGALTITQSESSCVVYGMPKVAVDMGASQASAAPAEIPRLVMRLLRKPRSGNPALAAAKTT